MQTIEQTSGEDRLSGSQPLSGKTALITGGSRGIGAAIVRRLARDGASVAFTFAASEARANEVAEDVTSLGGRALAFKADSGSPSVLTRAVRDAASTLGGIDIFVSNAGVFKVGLIDEFPLADLDQLIALNIRAVFVGVQAAVKEMKDGGRVIAIGSSAANRIAYPGISAYAMTKAAIQGLVRGLAVDLAPRAITVNNVQPGPIATDINPASGPEAESLQKMTLLRRYGTDEEVASLVAYLAHPDAAFVTGASITVDGGYAI